jgi:hypothetical protein
MLKLRLVAAASAGKKADPTNFVWDCLFASNLILYLYDHFFQTEQLSRKTRVLT